MLSETHASDDGKLLIKHGLGVLVDLNSVSWNQVSRWLSRLQALELPALQRG
jgi:hypothetical protein